MVAGERERGKQKGGGRALKTMRAVRRRGRTEGQVQAICEGSQLHLPLRPPPKDGHASSETDGEASVNECDNNRAVSPCSSGSGVTHLSLTLRDGLCVVPRVRPSVCVRTCAPATVGRETVVSF